MITLIEVPAVISGAIFGVLLARRKGMDLVGVLSVAMMTAFGGGTLRDVLLSRTPLFWIKNGHYPIIVFAVALIFSVVPRMPQWLLRCAGIADAFGMALFSAAGTLIALEESVPLFVAVLFGVITGTFGGVIGDIACNEVPSLFRPSTPLYATCSFLGSAFTVLVIYAGGPESTAVWGGFAVALIPRLLAMRFEWCLKPVSSPEGSSAATSVGSD